MHDSFGDAHEAGASPEPSVSPSALPGDSRPTGRVPERLRDLPDVELARAVGPTADHVGDAEFVILWFDRRGHETATRLARAILAGGDVAQGYADAQDKNRKDLAPEPLTPEFHWPSWTGRTSKWAVLDWYRHEYTEAVRARSRPHECGKRCPTPCPNKHGYDRRADGQFDPALHDRGSEADDPALVFERGPGAADAISPVLHALARLTVRQREAVTLRYLQDLSVAEIAHMLDLAERTVQEHIANGLQALRVVLDEDGWTPGKDGP